MDDYPEYRFACSQAQQYAWIKRAQPRPVQRIDSASSAASSSPSGAPGSSPTATSPPASRSSGSSCSGSRSSSASSAGAAVSSGTPTSSATTGSCRRSCAARASSGSSRRSSRGTAFNKPEHHTFRWQGIDGSECSPTSRPPTPTTAEATVAEIRRTARRLQGSRPLAHELPALRLRRRRRRPDQGDAGDAAPRRRPAGHPADDAAHQRRVLRASSSATTPTWPVLVGELYFEYHRGTYTSQAAVKLANRKCEFLLHDVELLAALAHWRGAQAYPRAEITRLWQIALLQPVPRHHPGLVDHRGLRGRASRLRRDRARGRDTAGVRAGRARATGSPAFRPLNTLGVARARSSSRPGRCMARRRRAVRNGPRGRAARAGHDHAARRWLAARERPSAGGRRPRRADRRADPHRDRPRHAARSGKRARALPGHASQLGGLGRRSVPPRDAPGLPSRA